MDARSKADVFTYVFVENHCANIRYVNLLGENSTRKGSARSSSAESSIEPSTNLKLPTTEALVPTDSGITLSRLSKSVLTGRSVAFTSAAAF